MAIQTYQYVLDFWFGARSSRDYLKEKSFWYGSPSDDAYVRKHLGELYKKAKDGKLDSWKRAGAGEGALALVLLLDQVPRNVFRWDKALPVIQRRYMYSPLNHSENLKDQQTSVELFTDLGDAYHLHWANDFHDQIKQNGRFTHRDWILQRS
ncbi:unnamed protein product [Penicillium pancosmium]